jgi:hypothetical protein
MSNRQSEGPIQVFTNDVREINDALAQIGNRLDHLKGLRGRTELWDRVRADDPTADQDVLTKGSLSTMVQVVFFSNTLVLTLRSGVSIAEISAALRRRFNFSGPRPTVARLFMRGWATESGTKQLVVKAVTTGATVCSCSWSGTTEGYVTGEATTIDISVDTQLSLNIIASSATECIVLDWVMLELSG